jgi:hypothetical protein
MNLEFEPGTFITLKQTNKHARHIVVDNNNVYKTNVYYEYYDNDTYLYDRIHELTVKHNFIFDSIKVNTIVLTKPNNNDFIKIFIDNKRDGSKCYELYLIEMDKMQ